MKIELEDIQGIITRGYGAFDEAGFLMLHIDNPQEARVWLQSLIPDITTSERVELRESCLNIAFTFEGLKKIGLDEEATNTFSLEFQEGMTTGFRQRLLGDHMDSDPSNWEWGTSKYPSLHMVLLVYAKTEEQIEALCDAYQAALKGLQVIHKLKALTLKGRKEHFGFRDGIAQPIIEGCDKKGAPENTIPAGEFIFGYKNIYEKYPITVEIDPADDPSGILPPNVYHRAKKDFARNGSYLVFRQIRQDVQGFWAYLHQQTHQDHQESIRLAAKMVGRWPSGAPLVKYPDQDPMEDPDDPQSASNDDSFGYLHNEDTYGYHCPFGSHIRRSNPRDAMGDVSPAESVQISNTHRVVRRGRAYGKQLMDPSSPDFSPENAPQEEAGLQFLCFNTNIKRQFEFIQHTWSNNRKFFNLNNDPDPISGDPDPEEKDQTAEFSMQAYPVRKRVTAMPRFTQVKGGAYFFMPGIRALKYLSALKIPDF